jgi:hypothetical protein
MVSRKHGEFRLAEGHVTVLDATWHFHQWRSSVRRLKCSGYPGSVRRWWTNPAVVSIEQTPSLALIQNRQAWRGWRRFAIGAGNRSARKSPRPDSTPPPRTRPREVGPPPDLVDGARDRPAGLS